MRMNLFAIGIIALLVVALVGITPVMAVSGTSSPQYVKGTFTWINQSASDNCVEAVAEMITKYYHDRKPSAVPTVWTQDKIWAKIVTNTPGHEVDRYYTRPNNEVGLGATLSDNQDGKPDWDNVVVTEIGASRPFKIGIRTPFLHAVAVTGYKIEAGVKYLYIYNPDPSTTLPYWQKYDELQYTNYVVVKGVPGFDN
jgi:hypothetical protein